MQHLGKGKSAALHLKVYVHKFLSGGHIHRTSLGRRQWEVNPFVKSQVRSNSYSTLLKPTTWLSGRAFFGERRDDEGFFSLSFLLPFLSSTGVGARLACWGEGGTTCWGVLDTPPLSVWDDLSPLSFFSLSKNSTPSCAKIPERQ